MDTQIAQSPQGKIGEAILAVMSEIGAIGKDKENKEQHYQFRSVDAVVTACHPVLLKHQMFVRPIRIVSEEVGKGPNDKGFRVRQKIVYRFEHADGSFRDAEVTGEGVDYGDKASNKCMSVSFKYVLCQTFCIPTQDPGDDPDNHSPEMGPPNERGQRPAKEQAQPKGQAQKPAAEDEKKQALKTLVALLGKKGIKGAKATLEHASKSAKRPITALGQLTEQEYLALKKSAEAMPDASTDVKE